MEATKRGELVWGFALRGAFVLFDAVRLLALLAQFAQNSSAVDEGLVRGHALAVALGGFGFVGLFVAGEVLILHEALEGFEGFDLEADHDLLEVA